MCRPRRRTFLRLLTPDLSGGLVFAQAEVDGLAQDAVLGPLLKLDLADELRIDPVDRGVGLRLRREWTAAPRGRMEFRPKSRRPLGVQAAAGMADVHQVVSVVHAKQHRAEPFTAATRLGKSADDRFLPVA